MSTWVEFISKCLFVDSSLQEMQKQRKKKKKFQFRFHFQSDPYEPLWKQNLRMKKKKINK